MNYTLIIIIAALALGLYEILRTKEELPAPKPKQLVRDKFNQEWIFLYLAKMENSNSATLKVESNP